MWEYEIAGGLARPSGTPILGLLAGLAVPRPESHCRRTSALLIKTSQGCGAGLILNLFKTSIIFANWFVYLFYFFIYCACSAPWRPLWLNCNPQHTVWMREWIFKLDWWLWTAGHRNDNEFQWDAAVPLLFARARRCYFSCAANGGAANHINKLGPGTVELVPCLNIHSFFNNPATSLSDMKMVPALNNSPGPGHCTEGGCWC